MKKHIALTLALFSALFSIAQKPENSAVKFNNNVTFNDSTYGSPGTVPTVKVEGTFQISSGTPGNGKVLTSNGSGVATWQVAVPGVTGATGATGPTGVTGATGATGATGSYIAGNGAYISNDIMFGNPLLIHECRHIHTSLVFQYRGKEMEVEKEVSNPSRKYHQEKSP